MIKYGLKLWTNNENLFQEVFFKYQKKSFNFIELYHNASEEIDFEKLSILKKVPAVIHNTNNSGFHEFKLGEKELEIWKKTKELADFFESPHIIVHAGKARNLDQFKENLSKIDDSRIIVENMPGLDMYGNLTFGYELEKLKEIRKEKEICFDLEKAVKSACYQKIDYKDFIEQCLEELKPSYFHISGGDMNSLKDEHLDLQEANFDINWIKSKLEKISSSKDIFLVFEVPKKGDNLKNDIKNMEYYKNIN